MKALVYLFIVDCKRIPVVYEQEEPEDKTERTYSEPRESKVSRYQFIKIIGATGILVSLAGFAGIIKTPWASALISKPGTMLPAGTKDFTAIKTPIDSHFVSFIQKVDKEFTAIKLTLSADFTAFKQTIGQDFTASKIVKGKDFIALKQKIDSDITAFKQKLDTIVINLGQNIDSDFTAMKLATRQYFSSTGIKTPTTK